MTRREKRLQTCTVRVGEGHIGVRLTDLEAAQLDALCMAFGMDKSGVIRLALDRLLSSMGGLTKPSDVAGMAQGEPQ